MLRFSIDLKDAFWWYWIAAFLGICVAVAAINGGIRVAGLDLSMRDDPVSFRAAVAVLLLASVTCVLRGVLLQRRSRQTPRMVYTRQHATKALEVMRRLLPHVSPREEYSQLVEILENPSRWSEAHAQFTRIRTQVTLPAEDRKLKDLDSCFAYVAENAAKTAYNCSGDSAPFDEDSFEWLLRCEAEFLARIKNG